MTPRATINQGPRAWTPGSPARFEVLGGPGGMLTCLPIGDSRRTDRYRRWRTLARVNRPITPQLREALYGWVLTTHEVV